MIVVVGLSHRTAPIQVRELIALPSAELPGFLQELVGRPEVGEAMIVSTCNRVEVVAAGRSIDADLGAVASACSEALGRMSPAVRSHLYLHQGAAAVRHLFRVAASLDSLVLGEPQILGQVKDAFDLSRKNRTLGPILNRTLPRALRAAKRVRSETSIGSGLVSVPSVAIDLTRQIFGDLKGRHVLLVGSGDMAETLARLLRGAGATVVVVGRNPERVAEVARSVGGEGKPWSELRAALAEADVVITSTSAPSFVIDHEAVAAARKRRRGNSQFFIDLAVPRDVDPRVEELDSVFLYNVDDLSQIVEKSLSARSKEAERAEAIVATEARGYHRWADAEQATPTIVALRTRLRAALEAELQRSLRGRLRHLGGDDRQALSIMLDAAVNRLLHAPTVRLRQAATDRGQEFASLEQLSSLLEELFELNPEPLAGAAADAPEEDADDDALEAEKSEPSADDAPLVKRSHTGVS